MATRGQIDRAGFSGGGVVVVLDQAAILKVLESEEGPVGKEILRRTLQVERRAKGLCPVDTGRLRASITSRMGREASGLAGIVGTSVTYAAPVEFGTRYMAARPFLRSAASGAKGPGGSGTSVSRL